MKPHSVDTAHGEARVHLHQADGAMGALVLGHGAGGGVTAPDILAALGAALECGVTVGLVEQPYRVAGRRSPAPARQLDAAWTTVVERLRSRELRDLPLVVGGCSLGARVACRTVEQTGPVGVLCLAFPVHPPRRRGVSTPAADRLDELDAVPVPTLVVQGTSDPFGMPPEAEGRTVVKVAGDHSLKADLDAVGVAVRDWLPVVVPDLARRKYRARLGSLPGLQ